MTKGEALSSCHINELINEIGRRSVACLIAGVGVEGVANEDKWFYGIKGSAIMQGAVSGALQMEIKKRMMEAREVKND